MAIGHGSPVVALSSTTETIRGVLRVRVNEAYTRALVRAGLVPLVIPPLPTLEAAAALGAVRGLLLTGGEDVAPARYGETPHPTVEAHEERDECEIALCRAAFDRELPTLAICRGIQVANVALGGSLIQDIPSQCANTIEHDPDGARDARVHDVLVESGSRLASALGADCVRTNSSHHQALDRIGNGLRVTARAPDGIVEGAESSLAHWWMLGVQWHPEELIDTREPWDRNLFAAFAEAVRTAAGERAP